MQAITVRLTDDLFQALKEHKQRTDVPTEAFVRRAIREQLFNVIVDSETEPTSIPLKGLAIPAELAAKIPAVTEEDTERKSKSPEPQLIGPRR